MDNQVKTAKLEDYFDFDDPDGIRFKGHRIWIEHVLFDYLDGLLPIEIALSYPTLSLAQIEAAIQYYTSHQETLDVYLVEVERREAEARAEQDANPPPLVRRLIALKARSHAAKLSGSSTTNAI